jgi:hypothetical protein
MITIGITAHSVFALEDGNNVWGYNGPRTDATVDKVLELARKRARAGDEVEVVTVDEDLAERIRIELPELVESDEPVEAFLFSSVAS